MSTLLLSHLGVICPSCDHLNAVGAAAQCAGCNRPLVEAKSAPKASPARVPAQKVEAPAQAVPEPRPAPPVATPPPAATAVPAPEIIPPGMRPTHRPASAGPVPAEQARPAEPAPVPASDLVRKPPTFAPPPKPAAPVAAVASSPKFGLVVIEGSAKGQRFRLPSSGAVVGKSREDPYVSPQHATLIVRDGRLVIRDDGSTSGLLVQIAGHETIAPGGCFSTGHRLFRYAGPIQSAPPQGAGRVIFYGAPVPGQLSFLVEEILVGGRAGRAVVSSGPTLTIGQASCDLSYAGDEGLAPRHCELSPMAVGVMVRDLSAGLGTFVRLGPGAERPLKPGDRVRIGHQVLQVEAAG